VTITPEAMEISRDGIELTKPSPIAHLPNWEKASMTVNLPTHGKDDRAADQVDDRDHDPGDRIPFDELAGTIHRAEEVRFPLQVFPTLSGHRLP
jgi:hypothetical protein